MEDDLQTLEYGLLMRNYKVELKRDGENYTLNEIRELFLHGDMKEQMDVVPGLYDAYLNRSAVELETYWMTSSLKLMFRAYYEEYGSDIQYMKEWDDTTMDIITWMSEE